MVCIKDGVKHVLITAQRRLQRFNARVAQLFFLCARPHNGIESEMLPIKQRRTQPMRKCGFTYPPGARNGDDAMKRAGDELFNAD